MSESISVSAVSVDELELMACAETRRLMLRFHKHAKYLAAKTEDGRIVGCVGWIEGKGTVRLGPAFVIPEFRRKGIFRALHEERMRILGRGKKIVANVTKFSLAIHLQSGAVVKREFKFPTWEVVYEKQ